jgi:hypothetical protein
MLIALCVNLSYAGASLKTNPSASIDVQVGAMRVAANDAGLRPDDPCGQPVYTDTTSWPGAGHRATSLFAFLILEDGDRPVARDGLVIGAKWYQDFVQFPSIHGGPVSVEGRICRLRAALEGLHLGVILIGETDTRFWFTPRPVEVPTIVQLAADGQITSDRTRVVSREPLSLGTSAGTLAHQWRLRKGRYLAMVHGKQVVNSQLRITCGGRPLNRTGSDVLNFPHDKSGAIVAFECSGGPVSLEIGLRSVAKTTDASLTLWEHVH